MGKYEMRMAVRVFLSSGVERTVDAAVSAGLDGPFLSGQTMAPRPHRTETVLTLRCEDVIGAEVLKDGVRIDCIPGCGQAKKAVPHAALHVPPDHARVQQR
jgi:hypothetical protein